MNRFLFFLTIAALISGCTEKPAITRYESVKDGVLMSNEELMTRDSKPGSKEEAIRGSKEFAASLTTKFDRAPKITYVELPSYPESAKNDSTQGVVTISFVVNELGFVEDAKVLSSPDERLSNVSLNSIYRWRFVPMTKGGKLTKVNFIQSFPFRLER